MKQIRYRRQLFSVGTNGGLNTLERSYNQFFVHVGNEIKTDLFGAYRFTFAHVGARAKHFYIHLSHHIGNTLIAFSLTLRQLRQLRHFG